ncbi:VOC family protein [Persicitalea jodogahamensis]|uniref:VOC domain-containing protein n=1 Tax=Persicitalea jodogahamensis TaxID=402147 RepID=A0A8J3GB87_9BACT|nr:VOC family protein [Persicitalea jodogahamensis]GHB80364.1 hypothetical protein GCM10007390_38270 [Persicitalea jodogahamensis]
MISRVAITVKDLARSVEFYSKVLNFTHVGSYAIKSPAANRLFGMVNEGQKLSVEFAVMSLGDEIIELMEFQASATTGEIPSDSASNDLWFQHLAIVVADMETAWEHLKMFDIENISPTPQTLPSYLDAAGISAYYFKDPDGHVLELIHFPTGKGASKWHGAKEGLFLGIDHTAIVVRNTADGVPFYQNLGFAAESQTENYGPQQEMLNQVKGARQLITRLASGQGMGVEFLDFINPDTGRPFPKSTHPHDLIHWHTVIEVDELRAIVERIGEKGYEVVSTEIAAFSDWKGDRYRGFIARDMDGHAAMICEKLTPGF